MSSPQRKVRLVHCFCANDQQANAHGAQVVITLLAKRRVGDILCASAIVEKQSQKQQLSNPPSLACVQHGLLERMDTWNIFPELIFFFFSLTDSFHSSLLATLPPLQTIEKRTAHLHLDRRSCCRRH
jgi:hypothetical protein